jgi:hypothetical protein
MAFLLFLVMSTTGVAAPPPAAPPPAAQPPPTGASTGTVTTGQAGTSGQAAQPAQAGAAQAGTPKVDTSRRETEVYGERLDALARDVGDLKDRVLRSKARLQLLKETVLHGVMAGSRVVLVHRNVMGSQFRLAEIKYSLDGAQVFARSESAGSIDEKDEIVIFDGNIVPGPHTVNIELTYKGRGFGVFSYLNGYTFESRSSHTFTAPENGALRLVSIGYEQGNLTTEMRDRPAVDWQIVPLDASGKPRPKTGGASKAKSGGSGKASVSGSASGSAKKGG